MLIPRVGNLPKLVILPIVRFQGSQAQQDNQLDGNLKSEVKKLYKTLVFLSKEWPTDLRPQIKNAFMKNKDVNDPKEIKSLIARGEYVCREITATYYLRKYRALKRRYYSEQSDKHLEELFDSFK